MGVLANLFPSLRRVRTPLASGLFLFLALAVVVDPPSRPDLERQVPGLVAVADSVGSAGVLVAVAFCAYLIGLTWMVTAQGLARLVAALRCAWMRGHPRPPARPARFRVVAPHVTLVKLAEHLEGRLETMIDPLRTCLLKPMEEPTVTLVRETEELVERLASDRPESHEVVDGHLAEAQFLAIAIPPGVVFTAALSAKIESVIPLAIGVALGVVLLAQAIRIRRRVGAHLASEIVDGHLRSPTLDKYLIETQDQADSLLRTYRSAQLSANNVRKLVLSMPEVSHLSTRPRELTSLTELAAAQRKKTLDAWMDVDLPPKRNIDLLPPQLLAARQLWSTYEDQAHDLAIRMGVIFEEFVAHGRALDAARVEWPPEISERWEDWKRDQRGAVLPGASKPGFPIR